jgi:hypothetical protein
MTLIRRHGRHGVLAAILAVTAAAVAPPAHAANTQRCHQGGPKVIKLPRQKDVVVTEQTCVIEFPQGNRRAKYKAWVHTTWRPTGKGSIRPKLFEDYNVKVRLEINRSGPDRVLGRRTCKIAHVINGRASGSHTCQTNVVGNFFSDGAPFTGDGSVVYDVDGDGKGNRSFSLRGSPGV